jgi:hypothetical protein
MRVSLLGRYEEGEGEEVDWEGRWRILVREKEGRNSCILS